MCNCVFCGHKAKYNVISQFKIFNCSVCGCYTINILDISDKFIKILNLSEEQKIKSEIISKYSSFLFYNKKSFDDYKKNNRYFIGSIDSANLLNSVLGESVNYKIVTEDVVDSFYPSTIKKMKSMILSKIYVDRDKANNTAVYSEPEAESLFFILRDYINDNLIAPSKDAYNQVNELLQNLKDQDILDYSERILPHSNNISLKLTLVGREIVENLEEERNSVTTINSGNLAVGANLQNSILGNNNTTIDIHIDNTNGNFTSQQKHDIESLERILKNIPNQFEKKLNQKLIANRRYLIGELDYIFDLEEIIADNSNYLCDDELRSKIVYLKESASMLSSLVVSRFGLDYNNHELMVLDYPAVGDNKYRRQYEKYLQEELPQAIIKFKNAYDEVCHLRIIKFGI